MKEEGNFGFASACGVKLDKGSGGESVVTGVDTYGLGEGGRGGLPLR